MSILRLMPNSLGYPSTPNRPSPPPQLSTVGTASSARISSLCTEMFDGRRFVRQNRESLSVSIAKKESTVSKCSCIASPLEPRSLGGKLLNMILKQEPHFFQLALQAHLHELTSERDRAAACTKSNSVFPGAFLHKRIEEIKEKERQIAVEDVMYLSVVYKFSEVGIPLIPKLSACNTSNRIEIRPSMRRELESINSLEVQEMIKEYVAETLQMSEKHVEMDGITTTKVHMLQLGRSYAASVVYGYFLTSACGRRESDWSVAATQEDLQPPGHGTSSSVREKLRNYVERLDLKSLQRCAKIKSKEAVNVIESHTCALFGDNIGQVDGNNEVVLTFPTLERIMLEAVNFGCFLWDVERSVDSVYGLTRK